MAFLEQAIASAPSTVVLLLGLVIVVFLHLVYRLAHDPLRRVPGPWLTRFTRLWELHQIRRGHFEQINVQLHQKYGLSFFRPYQPFQGLEKHVSKNTPSI